MFHTSQEGPSPSRPLVDASSQILLHVLCAWKHVSAGIQLPHISRDLQTPQFSSHWWFPLCALLCLCACASLWKFKLLVSLSHHLQREVSLPVVLFTTLDNFSSHHTTLHIPWSAYQLWIWEHNDACEYTSEMNKLIKLPAFPSCLPQSRLLLFQVCLAFLPAPPPTPTGSERVEGWDVGETM